MQRSDRQEPLAVGASAPGPGRRRWLILLVVGLGNMMSALDTFIVNVAIPSIRHNLHATPGDAELVVTVYALVFAVLLITGGRLGDLFGRSRMYLIGMAVFTAASALSGAAPVPAVLVGARALQAAGAALMVPQAYAVVQRVFDPVERVRALAYLTMGGSVAMMVAQLIGGSLIQLNLFNFGWRVVFYVNVPIGVAGLVAGLLVLPRNTPERKSQLDLPGVVLITTTLLLVVVPLTEGRDLGWPAWLLAMLVVSPAMMVVSLRYQRWRAVHRGMPLMDLTLFRQRTFRGGAFLAGLTQVTNAGLFFIIAVYLQTGRDLSPGMAGLVFAPLGLGYMSIAVFAPRVLHRLGRPTISIGYFVVAMAIGSMIAVVTLGGPSASPFTLVPSIYLIGAGQGFVNSPLFAVALSGVRPGQEGSASGLITTLQQTGASIGVAIEGLVFFSALGAAAGAIHVAPALGSDAFARALWVNMGIDLLCCAGVQLLPAGTAVLATRGAGDEVEAGAGATVRPTGLEVPPGVGPVGAPS